MTISNVIDQSIRYPLYDSLCFTWQYYIYS